MTALLPIHPLNVDREVLGAGRPVLVDVRVSGSAVLPFTDLLLDRIPVEWGLPVKLCLLDGDAQRGSLPEHSCERDPDLVKSLFLPEPPVVALFLGGHVLQFHTASRRALEMLNNPPVPLAPRAFKGNP